MYHMPSWPQRIAPVFNFEGVLDNDMIPDFDSPLPDYHVKILIR
jgi:hypothetical protein